MVKNCFCLGSLVVALSLSPSLARAADKKAEGELRWAMNYCNKVLQAVDRAKAGTRSADRIGAHLDKLEGDRQKYEDYLARAKALDATVTDSATVFDSKSGETFAQAVVRCRGIDPELAALKGQAGAATEAKATAKEETRAAAAKEQTREGALEEAKAALSVCLDFARWQGSSGLDERLATYARHKKASLEQLPALASEPHTARLLTSGDDPGTDSTRTFGEWFATCDKSMPALLGKLREKEKASAAAEQADAARRSAMNDRVRAEQAAKFNALVAATSGDRKRILQSKGFLPDWPRGGDLKGAPVWKWEVNITHEPQRCETFQFSGDKLSKNASSLGGCG